MAPAKALSRQRSIDVESRASALQPTAQRGTGNIGVHTGSVCAVGDEVWDACAASRYLGARCF